MTKEQLIETIFQRWKEDGTHPTEFYRDLFRHYRSYNPHSVVSESQRLIWEHIGA